jgi:hypothetical protein
VVSDPLVAPGRWENSTYPRYDASCTLDGELLAVLGDPRAGSYRCKGVRDVLTNFSVAVDVLLHSEGSCAGVWFRFSVQNGGYVVTVCHDRVQLWTHDNGFGILRSTYPSERLPIDRAFKVAVMGDGPTVRIFVGGELFEHVDDRYTSGQVVLGVLPFNAQAQAPYRVSFTNVAIHRAPATTQSAATPG